MNLSGIEVGDLGISEFPAIRNLQAEEHRLTERFAKRGHDLRDVVIRIQRMERPALLPGER